MIQMIFSAIRASLLAITSSLETLTHALEMLERQIELDENQADDRAQEIINNQRKTIEQLKDELRDKPVISEPVQTYRYDIINHKEMLNRIAYAIGIEGGKKIHAIKLIRELTGVGLLEAKNFVEAAIPPEGSYLREPDFEWLLSLNCDGAADGINTHRFIKMITHWDDDKVIKFMENMMRFPAHIENVKTVSHKYVLSDGFATDDYDDDYDDDYNDEGDIF